MASAVKVLSMAPPGRRSGRVLPGHLQEGTPPHVVVDTQGDVPSAAAAAAMERPPSLAVEPRELEAPPPLLTVGPLAHWGPVATSTPSPSGSAPSRNTKPYMFYKRNSATKQDLARRFPGASCTELAASCLADWEEMGEQAQQEWLGLNTAFAALRSQAPVRGGNTASSGATGAHVAPLASLTGAMGLGHGSFGAETAQSAAGAATIWVHDDGGGTEVERKCMGKVTLACMLVISVWLVATWGD